MAGLAESRIDAPTHGRFHDRPCRARTQRLRCDRDDSLLAIGREQLASRVGLARPLRDEQREPNAVEPAREVDQPAQRRRVTPLRIIDDHHERRRVGQVARQPIQAVLHSEPVADGPAIRRETDDRRGVTRRPRQKRSAIDLTGHGHPPLEELPDNPEPELALQRRGPGAQHGEPVCRSLRRDLVEQRGFADTRLALDEGGGAPASTRSLHHRPQVRELEFPLQQHPGPSDPAPQG